MDEISGELISETFKKFKPESRFQYIETHSVRLAIEI